MLRPRDGHDLRVLSGSLEIEPPPMQLRWIHDVFGNSVAIATFDERADTCRSPRPRRWSTSQRTNSR